MPTSVSSPTWCLPRFIGRVRSSRCMRNRSGRPGCEPSELLTAMYAFGVTGVNAHVRPKRRFACAQAGIVLMQGQVGTLLRGALAPEPPSAGVLLVCNPYSRPGLLSEPTLLLVGLCAPEAARRCDGRPLASAAAIHEKSAGGRAQLQFCQPRMRHRKL